MIRKTFICVAGILAGVSTGAYFDGFFEEENVVTDAYHQIVGNFNSAGAPKVEGDGSAVNAQNLNEVISLAAPEATPASSEAFLASDSTKADVADKTSKAPGSQSTSDDSAKDSMTSTKSKSKEMRDSSQEKRDSSQAMEKSKSQDKKPESQQDEKSIALLDLRFSKEIFKSPSGGELKYRKLSPRTVGNSRPLPLIVFLHGSGERGDDNVAQLKHGLDYLASREGMQKFPATIIAPQCPKDMKWSTIPAKNSGKGKFDPKPTEPMRLTLELINSIQITDNIDMDRVYVTGLSMGGFGTFDMIARRPSTFAAAVPLCGGGDTNLDVVNRFKKTPMWIIHGDSDKVVEVEHSRSMVAALKEVGGSPRYSELAGFKHNIWDAAYADKELYKWLFNQSRAGAIRASGSTSNSVAAKSKAPRKSGSGSTNRTNPKDSIAKRPQAPAKSLKEAIQSDWRVLAATRRGRRADAATLEKMLVKFEDDSMTIAIGDRKEAAKYKLPAAKNSPYPWIDMISHRDGVKDSAGILAMQGDKLVICWGLPGENRPTTFDSKEGVKTLVLEKK